MRVITSNEWIMFRGWKSEQRNGRRQHQASWWAVGMVSNGDGGPSLSRTGAASTSGGTAWHRQEHLWRRSRLLLWQHFDFSAEKKNLKKELVFCWDINHILRQVSCKQNAGLEIKLHFQSSSVQHGYCSNFICFSTLFLCFTVVSTKDTLLMSQFYCWQPWQWQPSTIASIQEWQSKSRRQPLGVGHSY